MEWGLGGGVSVVVVWGGVWVGVEKLVLKLKPGNGNIGLV